ncbi:unnamed protein product [Protopolystoma xenopodis]|uniref:Uncharacterized protein n=1 Tax=Protopolystoma xenopodis TaxID=117903 RepID=A0A3S5CSQ2_9PLAT|nr:unnamed protein product [Protopolystoma xenopodis]
MYRSGLTWFSQIGRVVMATWPESSCPKSSAIVDRGQGTFPHVPLASSMSLTILSTRLQLFYPHPVVTWRWECRGSLKMLITTPVRRLEMYEIHNSILRIIITLTAKDFGEGATKGRQAFPVAVKGRESSNLVGRGFGLPLYRRQQPFTSGLLDGSKSGVYESGCHGKWLRQVSRVARIVAKLAQTNGDFACGPTRPTPNPPRQRVYDADLRMLATSTRPTRLKRSGLEMRISCGLIDRQTQSVDKKWDCRGASCQNGRRGAHVKKSCLCPPPATGLCPSGGRPAVGTVYCCPQTAISQ